jgi:hypothetical protein
MPPGTLGVEYAAGSVLRPDAPAHLWREPPRMSLARCPHCGALNSTVAGWADLDHCSTCGKSLARQDPRAIEGRVRERLSLADASAKPSRASHLAAEHEESP